MTPTEAEIHATLLIERAMNLKKHYVQLNVPLNWVPNGKIPFDIAVRDGLAVFKVYALSFEEACYQVSIFMETQG